MDFARAVEAYRTTRAFRTDAPVERVKIQRILEAARLQAQRRHARLVRRAVVVTKGSTPDPIRDGVIEALNSAPRAAQAPVAIVWLQDMNGWSTSSSLPGEGGDDRRPEEIEYDTYADPVLAEWMAAFDCGIAVGSALLAAVAEGLGTGLITGSSVELRRVLNLPRRCTPTVVQLVGYPAAEGAKDATAWSRANLEDLYCIDTWGTPWPRVPDGGPWASTPK